jgi:hypothetical protein
MKLATTKKILLLIIAFFGIIGISSSIFKLIQTEERLVVICKHLDNLPGVMGTTIQDHYSLVGYLKDTTVNVLLCKTLLQYIMFFIGFLVLIYFFLCLKKTKKNRDSEA